MSSTGRPRPGAGDSDASAGRAALQPRARATRLAILTAAAEHFARDGYHATSLDSVLADSGGTKGALYFHFASKDALARAVVAEMVQGWRDLRGHIGHSGLDPLSVLLALVDEVITRLIEDPIARGGTRLLHDLPRRTQDAGEHYGCGERDTLDLLTQAAQAGLLREGIDPALVARQIVALIAGHRQICVAAEDRHNLRLRVDEAWTLLLPTVATDAWLATWRAAAP
ncbi:MAG: TetR/AcrR family transcriptional regulator [Actinomycetota bacterium]|nr:TetR/AcrR family transcriptional regulator [Actinomycetota bacterium]